ncbi:MAG: amidohydrolase, partial [Rhodobacteraceae bacterium]|nr:amidohydrolase [Paracoccaceae bacterium]
GGPVIAILGEYDALPGLSQVAGIAEPRAIENGGNGHGCGHNLLGAAALLAACAIKDWLEATGTPGRVRYYGCPAEEGGAAKTFMVRDGAFADVDAAITWHPDGMTRVDDPESLANTRMDFTFQGRASHAAATPHLGRSALDAAELMSVGVNYLREHMVQDARVHYAYLDAGGTAPNVVQARARVRYSIRALQLADMLALVERVKDVARGAALMTGTTVGFEVFSAVSNTLANEAMDRAMHEVLEDLGGVAFDEDDRSYARAIRATLAPEDIAAPWRAIAAEPTAAPLCDWIVPLRPGGETMIGSTDVADVSWACPTTEVLVATHAIGTPAHSWQITAQGKSTAAHKGMTHAAKAMARLAQRLIEEPPLLAAARAEHAARLARTPYRSPLPADLKAPILPRPAG